MARPRKHDWQRELRRYALADNKHGMERVLRHRLAEAPDDPLALAEMQRLKEGRPLQVTESPTQRRERELSEACQAIMNIMAAYPENILPTKTTARIRDLLARLKQHTDIIKANKGEEIANVEQYRKLLRDELTKRTKSQWRRASGWIAAGVGSIALIVGTIILCQQRANSLNRDLTDALKARKQERLQTVLKVADTGFNRTLCPALEENIRDANLWLTTISSRREWIEKYILQVENGSTSVSGMRMSLRAEIEKELQALPDDQPDLQQRWDRLCNKEKAQLEYQKAVLTETLLRPLPEFPTFTGNIDADSSAITAQIKLIDQRQKLFDEAPKSYKLSPDLMSIALKRREQLTANLKEIAGLRRLLEKFPKVRTYKQHREQLQEYTPVHYTPAVTLMHVRSKLPAAESVQSLMQDPQRKIDDNEMKAAIKTLLEDGPTFTQNYPANRRQVHLMEDVFTAPSLRRRLLELSNADGAVCYSEEEPRIDQVGRVYIRRSDLDPLFTSQNRNTRWEDASCVWKVTIDATPLQAAANINKPTFFGQRHLPSLLTTVLNFEHKQCPALAQAFVYHRLLLLIKEHDHPLLTGLNYSPSLRNHYQSFNNLVKERNIELRAGCWLGKTKFQVEDEAAFRKWFNTHRGVDYNKEIKENFGDLVKIGAAYCGYINEERKAVIFRELPPSTTIWYLTDSGIVASRADASLENPTIFSPIFIAEKKRY